MIKPTTAIALRDLSKEDIAWLQDSLNSLGFEAGKRDGLIGPRTLDAWADFKKSVSLNDSDLIELIGPSSYDALIKAIATQKEKSKDHDFSTKAGTIAAIRFECDRQGLTLPPQQAYVIATVEHETAGSFKPVEEGYYLGSKSDWFQRSLRYFPYYG
jgi:peptidoglycan hydrolase-like protein with peptidoglycan-binding domain